MHFLTDFIFVKNDFPVPINCLNCQSELVMPKIYQTEAKKTLVYSNYTGVRACTPCTFAPKNGVRARTPIHFSFISNFSKLNFWVWKHLKVLYWHVFIQYMLHRSIWTFISYPTTRRTSSYAVHFWPVQFWPASGVFMVFSRIDPPFRTTFHFFERMPSSGRNNFFSFFFLWQE